MFDIAPSEMLIVALVAIVLIGPKDLPRVMRVVGQWVGRGRALARQFRGAVDEMIRESELKEMEQKWKAENERIMREHADLLGSSAPAPQPPAPQPYAASLPPAPDAGAASHEPAAAAAALSDVGANAGSPMPHPAPDAPAHSQPLP
jgi:sec-independent protein translocase protein TatB